MLTLGAWLHDLDPFAVRFTDSLGIRWYGLAYVAGFAVGWIVLRAIALRGLIRLRPHSVSDLMMGVVLGTLLGGRLGYAIFYMPSLFVTWLDHAPWWGLLAINEGGMSSHGGLIGVMLACVWFARREGVAWLHVTDCTCLVAPIGIFFGRIANFVNGELLGAIVARPGQVAPWWAVKYPQELLDRAPELSDRQAMELDALLARYAAPGESLGAAERRMIDALQRGEAGLAEALAPLISARHPSQLYQAMAEGALIFACLWVIWARARRPGVISAWFLMLYGAGRVLTELIRLPDANVWRPLIAGLSRGQWLSVLMIGTGAVTLWYATRCSQEPKVGGWAQRGAAHLKHAPDA